jgi:hypothetical protein
MRNPHRAPLNRFWKNVIHSNGREGRRMYPNGFYPNEECVFEDAWSFCNKGDGILLFLTPAGRPLEVVSTLIIVCK